jgi:hypothetical protein
MFTPVYITVSIALLFYVILPVAGGMVVRYRWHALRDRIMAGRALPILDEPILQPDDLPPRMMRFFGEVDAISGSDELWLTNGQVSCVIDPRLATIYLLTGVKDSRSCIDDSAPTILVDVPIDDMVRMERVRWSKVHTLPHSARAYAIGRPVQSNGPLRLDVIGNEPVLLILHDGDDSHIEDEAIWHGRQQNEYWNPLTQLSLGAGILVMSGLVSIVLHPRMLPTVAAIVISLAFSPVLPLLPPGLIGFMLYRNAWKKARYYRCRRDLAALSNAQTTMLPGWRYMATIKTILSALYLTAGILINFILAVIIIRNLL